MGLSLNVCVCTQSCLTLCDLMDCSPPGPSIHRISQAYWSGLPFGDLPNSGIEPLSPALHEDSLPLNHLVSLKSQCGILQFRRIQPIFLGRNNFCSSADPYFLAVMGCFVLNVRLNKEEVKSPHLPQTGECGLDVLTIQYSFYIMSRN